MLLGLTLSFMVGPLLFAIVQAGIEKGFRAGVAVGAGIWASDILYIFLVYRSVEAIETITTQPGFMFWAGLAGGFVMIAFGIGSLLRRPTEAEADKITTADRVLDRIDGPEPPGVEHNWQRWGYLGYWLRGFLLNTINPFTVFFWLGISSAVIIPHGWKARQALWFFLGMVSMLISTDILKAYMAKRVREFLTPRHMRQIQLGIAIALIVFGIALILRAL